MSRPDGIPPKQLPHLVFGGELVSLDGTQFRGRFPLVETFFNEAYRPMAEVDVEGAEVAFLAGALPAPRRPLVSHRVGMEGVEAL